MTPTTSPIPATAPIPFDLIDAASILTNTPPTLRALLANLPDHLFRANYGENTFSPFDIVGHLIESEKLNWLPRLQHILQHRDSQPFPLFDRYAMYETSRGKSLHKLLDAFESLRQSNLQTLRNLNLNAAHLESPGLHPDLGQVKLKNLLAAWIAHDLHHTAQICKALARQYQSEVGPWRTLISILG